jgi:HD-GYP domain-containing protein (c-di-GMP phosphodiesterase class II)
MGFLGGLLGAAYLLVGPATMPLIIIGLLVGQFALRSYGRVLGSHDSALRAFARALEAKDLYSRGRSDQVAHFADLACDALGIGDQRRERMRTAALLREVTKLAVPHEIYRKPGPLHPDELHHLRIQMCRVSDLLADVEFLRPSLEIGNAGMADRPPDCTPAERPAPSGLRLDAAILAVAVAFEAMTSARSYRAAKTQPEAIAELRANQGTQFDPEAVDAFLQGLNASGEVHGAPPTAAPFEGALHG